MIFVIPILPVVSYIAHVYVLKTTAVSFIFMNLYFYKTNVVITSSLINFMIVDHFWAEVAEIAVEILSILVSVFGFFIPVINPTFVYVSSFLLPLPAITWFVKLGIIASNTGQDVDLW